MELSSFLFYLLGALAIASAASTVMSRNPVASAMSLVLHFFMLAGVYLTLQAQFIAVLQVLVYAGAIMVLIIFVIMLLNLGDEEKLREKSSLRRSVGTGLGIALLTQLGLALLASNTDLTMLTAKSVEVGMVNAIGMDLFTNYLFAFEAITLLLLVAVMGALILAKRPNSNEKIGSEA